MAVTRSATTSAFIPDSVFSDRKVRRAFDYFTANADEITREHIEIATIPAPPFGEGPRAAYFSRRFSELGLSNVTIDGEGNCLGLRAGRSMSPLIVLSAHLDTVFPASTDFTVHRRGGKLFSPGIADDGCGLTALLAIAAALNHSGIETEGSILFVTTVGEEGEGDLRGVKHLFTANEWAKKFDYFVSFDGPDVERVINGAIGSRRYRATLRGPGGHSWSDFGVANPVHALGRAIARLSAFPVPPKPRTTFNVGRISGGSGTNVIPTEATMDVDLRSESVAELQRLDAFFRRALAESLEDENTSRKRGGKPLDLELKLIGDRPIGETPAASPIIQAALESARHLGVEPRLEASSTDSNFPISLEIPAVTIGAGGKSGGTHTLEEWYDPTGRHIALSRAVLLTLGLIGLAT